jgi:hypothetical protein
MLSLVFPSLNLSNQQQNTNTSTNSNNINVSGSKNSINNITNNIINDDGNNSNFYIVIGYGKVLSFDKTINLGNDDEYQKEIASSEGYSVKLGLGRFKENRIELN